jgi:hypothetical protein
VAVFVDPSPRPSSQAMPLLSGWLRPTSPRKVVLHCALGAALVTLCFYCPRFWLWPVAGMPLTEFVSIQPEFHRAFHALQQLEHPWQRVDDPVNRVIEWRLFWPVVAHYAGLPAGAFLALPQIGCLLTLAGVAGFTWRMTRAALPTAAATFLAATSSWFFVSTGWLAYFDSWLILALLVASFAESRIGLLTAALLAPWIDERFILALPLCLAVRGLSADRTRPRTRREIWQDGLWLAAGVVPYIAVRFGAEVMGQRPTSQAYWADRPLLPAPFYVIAWGAWNGLRAAWGILALGAFALPRPAPQRLAWGIIGGTTVAQLLVADDLSRSVSIALPAVVAAVVLIWRARPTTAPRTFALACAANLLLPAQHVIAAPGTAARFHCVPVLTAAAEYEHAKNPPDFANPATYLRRSLDHFQARALERATLANDLALKFDPHFPRAIANRGVLLYVAGRKAEGRAELDRALATAPGLFEARMQRAAFRQEAGDAAGALTDVRDALQTMPEDWPRRKDAVAFERDLAARVGR